MKDKIFSLDIAFNEETGKRLIEWQKHHVNKNPYYSFKYARDRLKTEIHYIDLLTRENLPNLDRYDRSKKWYWLNCEFKDIVMNLIDPIKHVWDWIGIIHIQTRLPGKELKWHYDLHQSNPLYWPRHHNNMHWTLFIPISENLEDEIKNPPYYILDNDRRKYVTSNGKAFFQKQDEVMHGVDGKPYYRGLIQISGLINKTNFEQLNKNDMTVTKIQGLQTDDESLIRPYWFIEDLLLEDKKKINQKTLYKLIEDRKKFDATYNNYGGESFEIIDDNSI